MHPDDEPAPHPDVDPRAAVDRQFVAMVRAVGREDPRFVRRCSAPLPGSLAVIDIMIIVSLVATLLLGVVPLALGVHVGSIVLLAIGVGGCFVAPVVAPLVARRVVKRVRPLRS